MKKLTLKLLSCVLGAVTLFNATPISVTATSNNRRGDGLSTGAKVGIGLGAGAILLAGGIALICYLANNNDDTDESNSPTNANLSNRDNLCFWHSFVQQMYSLKTFRKFIDQVDLSTIDSKTAEKISAFREFFAKMDVQKHICGDECVKFAKKLLPKTIINPATKAQRKIYGEQNAMDEILPSLIDDVFDEYGRFCQSTYGTTNAEQYSNIAAHSITLESENTTLQDLLKATFGYSEEKRQAIGKLMKQPEARNQILKAYAEHICKEGTVISDDVTLDWVLEHQNDIEKKYKDENQYLVNFLINEDDKGDRDAFFNSAANTLEKFGCVQEAIRKVYASRQMDVPVLDNQFVLFVNRTGYGERAFKNTRAIAFNSDTVVYKNQRFQLTAVAVHYGDINHGHYYTYKKQAGNWYKYNDCESSPQQVSWNEVARDASKNCTMLTFDAIK